MVVVVVPFARLSRRARVVDGEDSEKRVEQKAAHGKPHIGPWMSDRLRTARICASDDAAFCQSSGAAWCAFETATAATLVRLLRLVGYQITCVCHVLAE